MDTACKALDEKYAEYLAINKEICGCEGLVKTWGELSVAGDFVESKVVELNQRIESLKTKKAKLLEKMLSDFSLVTKPEYRSILMMRYIYGMSWEEIAAQSGYEEKYAIKVRRKALNEIFSKKTPKDTQRHTNEL